MLKKAFLISVCSISLHATKHTTSRLTPDRTEPIETHLRNFSQAELRRAIFILSQFESPKELFDAVKNKKKLVEQKTFDGLNILHNAAINNHLYIIMGASWEYEDLNAQDDFGKTPLMYAIQTNNLYAASCLLNAGSDVHLQDKSGKRALDYAKEHGNTGLLRALKKAYDNQVQRMIYDEYKSTITNLNPRQQRIIQALSASSEDE